MLASEHPGITMMVEILVPALNDNNIVITPVMPTGRGWLARPPELPPDVAWPPSQKTYCFIVCGGIDGHRQHAAIGFDNRSGGETARAALILGLEERHPSLIIHDCASDLEAARLCFDLWPDEKTEQTYRDVERLTAHRVN